MTSLRQAWAALPPRLKILEPVRFSSDHWSLVERMHANFNDREAHTYLPLPIARFREDALVFLDRFGPLSLGSFLGCGVEAFSRIRRSAGDANLREDLGFPWPNRLRRCRRDRPLPG